MTSRFLIGLMARRFFLRRRPPNSVGAVSNRTQPRHYGNVPHESSTVGGPINEWVGIPSPKSTYHKRYVIEDTR